MKYIQDKDNLNNIIQVKLGDLIDSLSSILGEKRDNFFYSCKTNINEVLCNKKLLHKKIITATIEISDRKYFNCKFTYPLSDKKYINKDYLNKYSIEFYDDCYQILDNNLKFDETIDDIIVEFNLETFNKESYNKNLLLEALDHCKNFEKVKTKKLGGKK